MMSKANPTPWKLDIDAAARVWSDAPFPSRNSQVKARKAILAFVETLPEDATIADLRMELERC